MTRRWLTGLLVCSFFLSLPTARAAVLHVSKAAPPTGQDGLTWATAFLSPGNAVNAASAGDEVWVAAGAYNAATTMKEAVSLYGGFVGDETAREQRNPSLNVAILDGTGLQKSVIVFPAGVTRATVLDGFTIRNGRGTIAPREYRGGGVYCISASPVIAHNVFTGNVLNLGGGGTGKGGGIYCDGSSAPLIASNTFHANAAVGAAICADAGTAPEIADNDISNNSGGAAIALSGASGAIGGNRIVGNKGAAISLIASSPSVTGNLIADHEIKGDGAGISCLGGNPVITNNTFRGNRALDRGDTTFDPSLASHGGAIYCNVQRVVFPPPAVTVPSNPTISGNLFLANAATYGGAVALYGGTATMSNNTIAANGGWYCGGVYLNTPSGVVSNWTLANNLVAFNGGYGVYRMGNGAVTLRANNFFGGSGPYSGSQDYYNVPPGATDISADPLLPGLPDGNAHIAPNSPCVDAGNDAEAAGLPTDIDGRPRVQGAHVDIGADESDGLPVDVTARVVRVSPSGDDAGDGSSWAAAKRTVQAGINAVSPGGEVWVAEGAYTGPLTSGSFVRLYGGFAGTESVRDTRDWKAHPTVLDGNAAGPVLTLTNSARYNVVDGFTIQNGKGVVAGGVYAPGAAAPVIANNRVLHNTATLTEPSRPNSYYNASGGVYADGPATIRGNIFFDNTVIRGATAIYAGAKATVTGNTVVANSGGTLGSICVFTGGVVANNIVAFNSVGFTQNGATLKNNCVFGNLAFDYYLDYAAWDPTGADGNISADPKFASWRRGNLHLQPDSPCVDAGSDTYVMAGDRDVDGQPRVQGARVDIGADEGDGTVWNIPPLIVHVSQSGSDAYDGSSWLLAKRSIGAAMAAAESGDVWVAEGTYDGAVTIGSRTGLFGGFAGGETDVEQRNPALRATVLRYVTENPDQAVVTVRNSSIHTTVDGFIVRDSNIGIRTGNDSFARITGNEITRNIQGALLGASSHATVAGNEIRWNDRNGVMAAEISPGGAPTVFGNRITENGGAGVNLYGGKPLVNANVIRGNVTGGVRFDVYTETDSVVIANNLIAANGNEAGGFGGVSLNGGGLLVNNTIVHNRAWAGPNDESAGVQPYGSGTVLAGNIIAFNDSGLSQMPGSTSYPTFWNNDVYGNRRYNYRGVGNPTGSNGNVTRDPLFVDPNHGDFRLKPGSPSINTGDATRVVGTVDADEKARVHGGRVDMGAYENDGTAPPAPLVVRVKQDGDDAADGLSWDGAKRTIGAAMQALEVRGGGQVWVAGGDYPETLRASAYTDLAGGFAGGEEDAAARDWGANVTIVDAQEMGSVVRMRGAGPAGLVEGFRLTGGIGEILPDDPYHHRSGGAILLEQAAPTIRHNVILTNRANNGGAIYSLGAPLTIEDNLVESNASDGLSAAVVISGKGLTVSRNTFRNNAFVALDIGGADAEVDGNVFTGSATAVRLAGGGRVSGNLMFGNGSGLAVNNADDPLIIANNTLVDNTGAGIVFGPWGGGFMGGDNGTPLVANNIVAYHRDAGIATNGYSDSHPTFRDNDVFGNGVNFDGLTDPTGTDGNISADPLFVNRDTGIYRLLPGSPAVDAGDDSVALSGAVDLDGNPRIQGAHVDMGAYETLPAPTPADAVSALRVAAGLESLSSGDKARLDVERSAGSDGVVDLLDALALLRSALGAGG